MCKVLNARKVGKRSSATQLYIGRPSKWGNPFVIGRDGSRADVIAKYRAWIVTQPAPMKALDELRGRDLVCFCAPLACHGDLLLRLANGSREDMIAWWRARAPRVMLPIMPPDPQSQRLRRSPPRTLLADVRSGDCAGTPRRHWEPYRLW